MSFLQIRNSYPEDVMIYKPAYDVNFIFAKFFENWNSEEKHINFLSLLVKACKMLIDFFRSVKLRDSFLGCVRLIVFQNKTRKSFVANLL